VRAAPEATLRGPGAIRLLRARQAPAAPAVLCAVEPALASFEAVRQAAVLAAGGTVVLVAPRLPGDRSADTHLAAARFIADRAGVEAIVLNLPGREPVAELLTAAADYDAVVVIDRRDDGAPGRLVDIAVRHAPGPVLVSRRLPHGRALRDAVAPVGDDDAVSATARGAGATLLVVSGTDRRFASRAGRRARCSWPARRGRPRRPPGRRRSRPSPRRPPDAADRRAAAAVRSLRSPWSP
jgi:hypothetical protein